VARAMSEPIGYNRCAQKSYFKGKMPKVKRPKSVRGRKVNKKKEKNAVTYQLNYMMSSGETRCIPVEVRGRFRGTCCLDFQGQRYAEQALG
jgi:hypothetical protein